MLDLENVHAHYGSSHVLHGVSLHVSSGEAVALLGRNGVGKTTTISTVVGFLPTSEGSIKFKETPMQDEPPHRRARRGIALVPQGRGIFPNLSVKEHLMLPRKRKQGDGQWTLQEVYDLFPRLKEREKNSGDQLSGGEQQMLSIARALRAGPELLLLDEPSDGLSPIMVDTVAEILSELKRRSLPILLVEQNIHLALSVADRVYIMNKGVVVHECEAKELAEDKETQHKWLGV